jgi:hypothetical protein
MFVSLRQNTGSMMLTCIFQTSTNFMLPISQLRRHRLCYLMMLWLCLINYHETNLWNSCLKKPCVSSSFHPITTSNGARAMHVFWVKSCIFKHKKKHNLICDTSSDPYYFIGQKESLDAPNLSSCWKGSLILHKVVLNQRQVIWVGWSIIISQKKWTQNTNNTHFHGIYRCMRKSPNLRVAYICVKLGPGADAAIQATHWSGTPAAQWTY